MTAASDGSDGPQRDERGHFLPGNRIGRGNPVARRQRELAEAIRGAVTAEDLRAVFASLVTAAQAGDVQAAGLLMKHAVGTPREVDPPVELSVDVPLLTDTDSAAVIVRAVLADVLAGHLPVGVGDRLLAMTAKAISREPRSAPCLLSRTLTQGTSNSVRISAAVRIVSQSLLEPMTRPTSGAPCARRSRA